MISRLDRLPAMCATEWAGLLMIETALPEALHVDADVKFQIWSIRLALFVDVSRSSQQRCKRRAASDHIMHQFHPEKSCFCNAIG
jgi:hypothetical protein